MTADMTALNRRRVAYRRFADISTDITTADANRNAKSDCQPTSVTNRLALRTTITYRP